MEFDPYSQWLEIPADRRPPTFYDLLGLEAFESDAGRIRSSALERTNRVRRYQLGQHGASAIRLLGEISLAFDTLTRPDRKQQYDKQLAGMATEDRDAGAETVVTDAPQAQPSAASATVGGAAATEPIRAALADEPPPVQIPTSPFQAGFVPAPAAPVPPKPRKRRSLAHGLRQTSRGILSTAVYSLVFSVKAALWSVRLADRAMCKSLGDENAILHNFFRCVAVAGIVGCLAAGIWFWPTISAWLLPPAANGPTASLVERAPEAAAEGEEHTASAPPNAEQKEQPPLGVENSGANPSPPQPVVMQPVMPVNVSTFTNSLGMQLARIPAGQFMMGSPTTEAGRVGGEYEHVVRLGKEFCLGVHEVTQEQFQQVMGAASSPRPRDASVPPGEAGRMPASSVLWSEAAQFCQRLSERLEEQAAGRRYRLPTEAEWEYACRAGTATAWNTGSTLTSQDANLNSGVVRPKAVGLYRPNAWGLFDMHGNMEEWCADYYDYGYYRKAPTLDPAGPAGGLNRVCRGGSYLDTPEDCRSARRVGRYPGSRMVVAGFRVACDLTKK